MAAFDTHLSLGIVSSGALALAAESLGLLEPALVLPWFALATLGNLLPDLDADHSTPLQLAFTALSIVAAFLLALWSRHWFGPLWQLMLVWLGGYLVLRWGVFHLFTRFTVHRGIIHSLPVAALFGSLTAAGSYWLFKLPAWPSWALGIAVSLGFVSHLLLDEISSVNLMGIRSRKSFGTALKLWYRSDLRATAIAWLLLALSLPLLPPAEQAQAHGERLWRQLSTQLEWLSHWN